MILKKTIIICSIAIIILTVIFLVSITGVNLYMSLRVSDSIYAPEENVPTDDYDCILVLGAGVRNGQPSDMLKDRLTTAIELYENGVAPKLLMSGDHGTVDYDEVNVMKNFAIEQGVPSEDIFMDHAGFSTYESIYRAKEIFGVDRVIVVSQKYHLTRALYIAEELDLSAVGVSADVREYKGDFYRGVREILARYKDFFKVIVSPSPTYLGNAIPISGNGNITNDKTEEI